MTIKHVISVSGGKDSLATLLIAIARFGRDRIVAIFCDTGNEHELTYAYLAYLERVLCITITRLKASFAELNIHARVEWSKTTRGGRQYDLLFFDDPTDSTTCSSAYGLCE